MSAAAISPAPSATAGASAATGAGATGAGVTGQAHGPLTGFDALLAMLSSAEDSATDGAASGPSAGQVKVGAQVATSTPKASSDDSKTKGKTTSASDTDPTAAAAGATSATTVPDATIALLVPAVPTGPVRVTPPASPDAGGAAVQADANGFGAKAQSPTIAAGLAPSSSGAVVVPDAGASQTQTATEPTAKPTPASSSVTTASTASTPAAATVDSAATNATANVVAPANQPQPQPQPQVQAATPLAAPVVPTQTAGADAVTVAAATAPPVGSAKTAPPTAPVAPDSKGSAPKIARSDPGKADAGKADAAQNTADTATATSAKTADALAPVTGGASKRSADDKGEQAPATEAQADQPQATQPQADPATASAATPATLAAAAQVRGSPQTVANLSAEIVKKLDARSTQFDVQLDPAGLGKVDVRVQIGADGKMSAAMSFDTPQAAAELRSRASELHQAMQQAGFDISGGMSFDVAADSGQGGQAQNQQSDTGAAFRGRAFQAALDTTADAAPPPQLPLRRTAASGVDIRI
jgi:Meckel syndrome type 1 protein